MSSPTGIMLPFSRIPYTQEEALDFTLIKIPGEVPSSDSVPSRFEGHVPNHPSVSLHRAEVDQFLRDELSTPLLDHLYPVLWLAGKKSSRKIDALHRHLTKGRAILAAEEPKLHLIWDSSHIFIKPVPACLLNHQFWEHYIRGTTHEPIAIGFLRSYAFLIKHPSDFKLALEHNLIPSCPDLDWLKWARFITNFQHLKDDSIARRYHYGQLRISRLNWVVRIYGPPRPGSIMFYKIPFWNTASYLQDAVAPLIFIFASLSLALSSMQVVIAVPVEQLGYPGLLVSGLQAMSRVFWGFSIMVMMMSAICWVMLLVLPCALIMRQVWYGFTHRQGVSPWK